MTRDHLIRFAITDEIKQLILELADNLPVEHRQYFIEQSPRLINSLMNGDEMRSILCTFHKIHELFNSEMNEFAKINIVKCIARVPIDQQENIVIIAVKLIHEDMDFIDKLSIIKAVITCNVRRIDIFTCALLYMTPEMAGLEKVALINAVRILDPTQFITVFYRGLLYMTPEMSIEARLNLINALEATGPGEIDYLSDRAILFTTPEMNAAEKLSIIRAIQAIQPGQIDDVIMHARRFIRPQLNAQDRVALIQAVTLIPVRDRAEIVRRAIALGEEMNPLQMIVQALGQHRNAENRPNGNQLNQLQVAAVRGVNVHDDERDLRTGEAVALLRTVQRDTSYNQIMEAKNAFAEYLATSTRSPQIIHLAQQAFEGTPRAHNEAFGSLIDGQIFGLVVTNIMGEELIGRLWIFASQLSEKEQINTKEGMISALADSYQDNERVCNQGKAQRLALAVLQGNLRGVNIEGQRMVDAQVTSNEAIRLFFLVPANQTIQELHGLLEAANVFCNNNLQVNREEFLQKINTYAELNEIQ